MHEHPPGSRSFSGACHTCGGTGRVPDGRAERAEFIRVQCELARTPRFDSYACDVCGNAADDDGCVKHGRGCYVVHGRGCYVVSDDGSGSEWIGSTQKWIDLSNRADQLHGANRERWWPADGLSVDWKRGFIDSLGCTAAAWIKHADAITAAHPVTRVRLTTLPEFRRPENALRDVFQLAKRQNAWIVPLGEYIHPYLLRKEWPGIDFDLPIESYWPHQSPAD